VSSSIVAGITLLFVALAAPVLGQSQATTGVIEGIVTDANGDPAPGAEVTLRNTATNFERVSITDSRGRFRAVLLPLGPYQATAELASFASQVIEDLRLTLGEVLTLRFQLQLATVSQQIVVTGERPLIEVSQTENTVTIDRATIERVPNNGRNFLDFTLLTPGVSIVQGPDGDELTINGQKGIQNNVSVDGADFNNPFFGEQRGGQRPAFTFNLDAVQEFVVVPDGAPAEFGRSSGGFVNVVTKSGTNATSGTATLFFANDSLSTNAKRPDGGSEPDFDSEQTQLGFTLGGPLTQDKVFYFLAVDRQDGDSTKQKDPNRIPPEIVAALASLGSPGENGPITRTDDSTAFLGKIDWLLSSRTQFTLRGTYTDSDEVNGTFDVDSWGRSANAVEQDESFSINGSLVSTLGDAWLNELRFQFAREDRPRPYEGPTITGTDRPLPDIAFDFGGAYRFGMPFFIPVEYHDDRIQLVDNVTWLRGEHTLKGGVEYNETGAFQTFIGFANGRFIFDSSPGFLNYLRNPNYVTCSDGSSSEVAACPAGTSITGPVLLYLQQAGVGGISVEEAGTQDIVQKEPAIFVQDTWQPRADLTISLGLRWEAQIQPDPITPADEVFYAPFIGRTVTNSAGTFEFPSNGKIPTDYDMWQPRVALAWNPDGEGKSVVRASAGIYYGRIPGLVLASSRSTNGSRGQTLFRNSAASPFLGPPPPLTELIPAAAVGNPFQPEIFVFDEDFQNPRTVAYALAYERQFLSEWAFIFKYNYNQTEHLTRFVNRNDPLFGSPWSTGLGADGSNGVGNLITVESTAESLYQAATVGVEKRFGGQFQLSAYYTYSKDKSDDDNERDPFTLQYARVTDLDREWSYSNRDQRDRFNAFGIWRAPAGIHVSGRFSYRSPQPISITENGTVAAAPSDRINADGSVTQRNLGRKDNKFSSVDLRVSKDFRLSERFVLEGIVEVFNLLNSDNFRVPEDKSLVFNFDGTVQSGLGDPRQIQLGARLKF
jgi:hypothetical protein